MKNKIIISAFIIVVLINIFFGVYFIFFHDKEAEDTNWIIKQAEKGNLYVSVEASNDISKLKQGDIVDIYMYGKNLTDEMSKTPLIKNAIVAYDYDKSTDGAFGVLIPEGMHNTIKGANEMASIELCTLEIKKSNSQKETEIILNQELKEVIDTNWVQVEVNFDYKYVSIEVSNDIGKLKEGDIIDVYMYGKDITKEMSKTPLIKNAIVANDYEETLDGLVAIWIPEEMYSIIKGANAMVIDEGYILEIKKSKSQEETEIILNQEIKKVIDEHWIPVADTSE